MFDEKHLSASRLMLPPRSVICGQIPSSIWVRRPSSLLVVGRVLILDGLLHCCWCIRRSPFLQGKRGTCLKDMINRKQRCVRDGALASLLENERCQDLQEYQQVLHGHDFKPWK